MRFSIRNTFAIALFVGALLPLGILAGFQISPLAVEQFRLSAMPWLRYAAIGAAVALVLAMLYPPFLPTLRLRSRRAWRRLGTDRGPMFEGLAQLRNLETHANRLVVGRMARQLGDVPIALENLTRAHEIEPTHVGGRYQLALLLEELGRLDEAAPLFAEVIEADATHAFGDAMLHLGDVYLRRDRAPESLVVLRQHQKHFPGNRRVHLLAALALARTGEREAAEAELDEARRPAGEGEHMPLEESVARARARVTRLILGGRS